MGLSWVVPAQVTLGDPTTDIVTAAEVAYFVGGADATVVPDYWAGLVSAASEFVEEALGSSLRTREVAVVLEAKADVPVWLPWGLPTDGVTATLDGDAYTDFETARKWKNVDFLTPEDAGELEVTYSVGSATVPGLAKEAVLRVAATMYHNRFAENAAALQDEVRRLLPGHVARGDWA